MDGLASRENDGVKVILPVGHNINAEAVREASPMLADRVATSSSKDLERVIEDLMQAIAPNARVPVAGPPEPVTVGAR